MKVKYIFRISLLLIVLFVQFGTVQTKPAITWNTVAHILTEKGVAFDIDNLTFARVRIAQAQGFITWTDIATGLAKNGTEVIYKPINVGSQTICYAKVDARHGDIEDLTGFTRKQLANSNVIYAGEIDGFWTFNLGNVPCPPPGAMSGQESYVPEPVVTILHDAGEYPFPIWPLITGMGGTILIFVLWKKQQIFAKQRIK